MSNMLSASLTCLSSRETTFLTSASTSVLFFLNLSNPIRDYSLHGGIFEEIPRLAIMDARMNNPSGATLVHTRPRLTLPISQLRRSPCEPSAHTPDDVEGAETLLHMRHRSHSPYTPYEGHLPHQCQCDLTRRFVSRPLKITQGEQMHKVVALIRNLVNYRVSEVTKGVRYVTPLGYTP